MIDPMPETFTYWHWWIAAVLLLVIEVFAPGAFFLWMGVAAGVVGLLALLAPSLGWELQALVFAVISVASIVVWRRRMKRYPIETDHPALNRRGEQYVGRVFTLDAPIADGSGKVRIDDSVWKIAGEDCPAGVRVRVAAVDGTSLRVEPVE